MIETSFLKNVVQLPAHISYELVMSLNLQHESPLQKIILNEHSNCFKRLRLHETTTQIVIENNYDSMNRVKSTFALCYHVQLTKQTNPTS